MKARIALALLISALPCILRVEAQETARTPPNSFISVAPEFRHKLASGRLLVHELLRREMAGRNSAAASKPMMVTVYMRDFPNEAELAGLLEAGIKCHLGTWTPPMHNHPLGFFLAELAPERINDALRLECVRLLGSAEGLNRPQNNLAARAIRANAAWSAGWKGKGVRVGVLDSGIDTTWQGGELPDCFARKDYSEFPLLDDDVSNRITAHGTHVTGTIVGRGLASERNTGNGGGAYRGMAPEACLAFLKIGNDTNASANNAACIAALHDAVSVYGARVINMSYGGWDAYHDGSDPLDQKADWCFQQGTAVAFSAGNSAASAKHAMGTVPAGGESDLIELRVNGIKADESRLSFNLVWFDGPGVQRALTLKYFDPDTNEITDLNIAPVTESPRGTQSQYSSTRAYLPEGNSKFFLKVANSSAQEQVYHIYEDRAENERDASGSVTFADPSAAYTVGSPSTADHVLSVAAWVSRSFYVSALGNMRQYRQATDKIASFSSRGPRVDGRMKPDIAAPGSALISLRDTNIYTAPNDDWVDDDGVPGGAASYTVMQGTSMASPVLAGALALVFSKYPHLTPQQAYDSLLAHARRDAYTGTSPNAAWGAGKLDVGFLAGMPEEQTGGWTDVSRSGWNSETVGDIAASAQGKVYATVGSPWNNGSSTLFGSVDNGVAWTGLKTADGLAALCVDKNGRIFAARRFGGRVYRSGNGGADWDEIGEERDYTALTFFANDSVLLAGTYGQGVFRSEDGGDTWAAASDGLPPAAKTPVIAGGGNGYLYAAVMDDGVLKLYRAHRSDYAWSRSDAGIDTTKNINAIAVTPDGIVFAAVWDRVYRSMDDGGSWTQVAILNDYLQSLCAVSNTTVLAGTVGAGVYRSIDLGASWHGFSEGLKTLNAGTLRISPDGNAWTAGTPGSVYRRALGATPPAPSLYFPANNSPAAALPVQLRWSTAAGADSYTLQISTAQDFSPVHTFIENIRGINWTAADLTPLTKYFWRVRALSGAGAGPWSAVWNFTTAQLPPPAPLLVRPEDGAVDVPAPASFQWTPAPTAASYRLQVAADTSFSPLLYESAGIAGLTHDAGGLPERTHLYWRLRAENSGGDGPWSAVWSFTTAGDVEPEAPRLLAPPDRSIAMPLRIDTVLAWSPVEGASEYLLQFGDSAFTQPYYLDTALAGTSVRVAVPSTRNSWFYWRVAARSGTATGPWSQAWSFTTLPGAPVVIDPRDAALDVPVNVTLLWNKAPGASAYSFAVALDSAFTNVAAQIEGLADTAYAGVQLAPSTRHFWRVRAENEAGEVWGSTASFTTGNSTGAGNAPDGMLHERTLLLYPQPARDRVHVLLPPGAGGILRITVRDALGRVVMRSDTERNSRGAEPLSLDAASWPAGIYFIQAATSRTLVSGRCLLVK